MKERDFISISLLCLFLLMAFFSFAQSEECRPTEPDMLGPFYKPGAPVQTTVGKGYVLTGVVKSSKDCSLLRDARIEFWLTSPLGEYDDEHRATVLAGTKGSYRFEGNYPMPYGGRPPHIHLRISAEGFRTLVTQHYPEKNSSKGNFDLVLIPEAN
jgi:catechol 1,2-dioxygenase